MSPKEIPDELIDQLLAGHEGPEAITGPDGLLKKLTKRVVERAMSAELTDHLGYELGDEPPEGEANRRNGSSSKTLITDHGPVPVDVPREREGSFEPLIVPKHQRRFAGFDDKIISMYARGMTTREISKHLEEIYGVEVGRDTISRVTDAVLEDVKEWQSRPLEKLYLVVWLDAIVLKIRDQDEEVGVKRNLLDAKDAEGGFNPYSFLSLPNPRSPLRRPPVKRAGRAQHRKARGAKSPARTRADW